MVKRKSIFVRSILAAGFLTLFETSAAACLPPPPGWQPPSAEERVRGAVNWATDIAYGVMVRGSFGDEGQTRFRIIHVYKGSHRPGSVIEAPLGWGLEPPMCAGMLGGPPPLPRGTYGVVLFQSERPELNFVSDQDLQLMFTLGLIQSARPEP